VSSQAGKALLRELKAQGWTPTNRTKRGHMRLVHPKAHRPIYVGTTPAGGTTRARANALAEARRALDPDYRL
jgi:predicted RNA binding protein YcfA (HicA-like mRNA interferase family)